MSKKVIKIMKAKMSLEERKKFVANCLEKNPNWERDIDGKFFFEMWWSKNSFLWFSSKEGREYWCEIYIRFTKEELNEIIKIK